MSNEYLDIYSGMFSSCSKTECTIPSPKKVDKDESIKAVRALLETKGKTLSLPPLDDNFILRFLHARKMNVEASFQLLSNYFAYRKNNENLFRNLTVDDPTILSCLRDALPFVLKSKDRHGRCVLVFLVYQWDHSVYTVETIYKALLLTMQYLLEDIQNQINGFVFVVDWSNFKLRDYMDVSPKTLKLMIDGFQDSFPAKIKGCHFIGQPWYVDTILTLIKTFLKEKTKQKLIIHGTNVSKLHEYLPPDILIPELGGEGEAYKPDELIEILKDYGNRSTVKQRSELQP